MATFGSPFTKFFTDKDGIGVYNSSGNPGSAGDTYTGVGVKQNPRLTQNVTVQTVSGAPGGKSSALRCYTRPAPVAEGNTPAGWWSTSGMAVQGGRQKWGKWEYAVRRQEGLNTKGVWLLWPIGPNKNGWLNAPPGSCNEFDMVEWFDQAAAGGVAQASCNVHYRAKDGSVSSKYQKQIPHPLIPGVDWTAWHVVTFICLPNQTDMLIDGVRATGFPLTNPLYLQQVQMYFAMQMALLIDPGQTRGSTSRETAWMDMAYLKVYPLLDAEAESAPSIPANLQAIPIDPDEAHYTWSASVDNDPNSPVKDYPLQRALITPDINGVVGSYTALTPTPTATSYRDTGLTPGAAYAVRVAGRDTALNQSEFGDPVKWTQPTVAPVADPPKAKLIITGVDDPSITSENGAINTTSPFHGFVDPTQSSGSITKVDIDYGNGNIYPGVVMPASPTSLDNTWNTADEFTVTLTVWGTDPGTGVIPFDQDTVTIRLSDPTRLTQSQNYGWFLPKAGNPVRADELYDFITGVDDILAQTMLRDDTYQSEDDLLFGATIAGDDYRRVHMTADGRLYESLDGTYSPRANAPILGPGGTSGTPSTQPVNDIQFSWVATNNTGAGSANPETVNFPSSVPTGYALLFMHLRNGSSAVTTPAGWTLLGTDKNGNGNSRLYVFGKLCGSDDNGDVVSVDVGSSIEGVLVMVGYVNNATVGTVVASMVTANAATAQTGHPTPNTLDSTTTNQMEVRAVGLRFSNSAGNSPADSPDGMNTRGSAITSRTDETQVALTVADRKLSAITTDSTASNFKTGIGAFSVGATVILAHA
jgi:hypothetical protein